LHCPTTESVLVYRPGQLPVQFADEDVLNGDDVLSGFTVSLTEMFAEIAKL
jgi:hypothetical protein